MARLYDRHQDRLQPFHQGYKAWGKGGFDNPYPAESISNKEWQHGQDIAYLDNKYRNYLQPLPRKHM